MRRSRWVPAAVVVVVVVLALVLTGGLPGRGEEPEPTGLAVVTAGPWVGGQPPAEWAPIEVPERLVGLLASPERVAGAGVVAARDVPGGVLVRASDLDDGAAAGVGSVLVSVQMDVSGWPGEGPQPGAEAMLVDRARSCAAHVVTLLDVAGATASVAADPDFARLLELGEPWKALPAPADGEGLGVWRCAQVPAGRLVLPVRVSGELLSGGPLRPGETVLLVPAPGQGEGVCAAASVRVWGVPGEGTVTAALTRAEAAMLLGGAADGSWRAVRLPEGRSDAGVWRC